ncbi:unnamed protein product, partial [Meganyctiphanes norvegica]
MDSLNMTVHSPCSVNGTGNGSDDGECYEHYEYDYEAALDTYYWTELAPALAVYAITYVVGVVGNVLIIFTICRYRRLKSTTNVFLASLSSADLVLILICIPVKIARLLSYAWWMGEAMCKIIYYLQAVSAVCSVLTLTTMSLERCYAIINPMKSMYVCTISKAKKAILIIWVSSFLLASPVIVVQVNMEVGNEIRRAYWCVRDFDNGTLWQGYETYMLVLVLVLPTIIMGTAYSTICLAILSAVVARRNIHANGQMGNEKKSSDGGKQSHRPSHEDKTIRQVVPMLLVVVFLFIICWGPILIVNMLKAYGAVPPYDMTLKHWITVFDLMSYFNSCVNPIVYGFMSRHFRKGFKRALCFSDHNRELTLSRSQTQTIKMSTRQSPGPNKEPATVNGNSAALGRKRIEYGRGFHQTESMRTETSFCHV